MGFSKLYLILFLLFSNNLLLSENSITEWIHEVNLNNIPFSTQNIFLVNKLQPTNIPNFIPIDTKEYESLSFFKFPKTENAVFSFSINQFYDFSEKNDLLLTAKRILANESADCLIYLPENLKESKIVLKKENEVKTLEDTKETPNSNKSSDIIPWVFSTLGYNAVIISEKKSQFLAIGSKLWSQKNAQALVYTNSLKKLQIQKDDDVAAILQIKESFENYIILEPLLSGMDSTVAIGSKVQIILK